MRILLKTRALNRLATFALLLLLVLPAWAQEPSKPQAVTPSARLAAAKTAFLRNGGGNAIPFDVISMSFADWARFKVVEDPAAADVIIEVASPDDGRKKEDSANGFGVSSQGKQVAGRRDQPSAPANTRSDILLAVYDAKTKATLWSATEKPNSVQKGMSKDEKFVAAAQRLMSRLRERIEPAAPQQ